MPIKSGIITMDTLYVNFLRTGLQLAYFFHQANRDYTVYERHDMAGWSRNNEYIHYALSYCIPYRKVRASVLIEHCTFMHTYPYASMCVLLYKASHSNKVLLTYTFVPAILTIFVE